MFYTSPFLFSEILHGHSAPRSSLKESIDQHLQMLIATRPGENRYDFGYGNKIWDLDFENAVSNNRWEEAFQVAVLMVIQLYEWRLTSAQVAIRSELVEKAWPMRKYTEIKKKVNIWIQAQLTETGEQYIFRTALYISPLSTD